MSGARYEIQSFDFANGGRSWHVYDTKERHHIHTATHGFLNEDNSEPICCTKICTALNAIEAAKTKDNKQSTPCSLCEFTNATVHLCKQCCDHFNN